MRENQPAAYQLPNVEPISNSAEEPKKLWTDVVAKGAIGTGGTGVASGLTVGFIAKMIGATASVQALACSATCMVGSFGFFLCFLCRAKPCSCWQKKRNDYIPIEDNKKPYALPPMTMDKI